MGHKSKIYILQLTETMQLLWLSQNLIMQEQKWMQVTKLQLFSEKKKIQN